jgi:hypothetical protein
MVFKKIRKIITGVSLFIVGTWMVYAISSCGKSTVASPTGLNIQYQILNLSPDLLPVNLFIDFSQVNALRNPFIFGVNHGYFYVPSIDTPYQIRTSLVSGGTIFSRNDILKPGAKYTLFITGSKGDGSQISVFTVDTSTTPAIGRGKLRFVNVSPTGINGLDVYANGTKAFSSVLYTKFSNYIELPAGNYDLQITNKGSTTVLKDLPAVTIHDGKLYTLYSYGYTSRIDTAAFNAAVITNR